MKKLLILAAVAVASVAVNAASFKWSAGNIYASNGTDKYTGDVTLYAYLATADVSTAIAVSTVTASASGAVTSTTFSNDSLSGGNDYVFFFTIEDSGNTFTSTEKTVGALATQTQNIAFGNMASATQTKSNWVSSSVPEPTSGLMLLLGMAGLALRRKRA